MTLLEAYRYALVEGLTAKQAGAKFNLSPSSIAKCKSRYGLPSLKNEFDVAVEEQLNKMNDTQLLSYSKALELPKNSKSIREIRVCRLLLSKRGLCKN